jgi:hypothetical protein
MERELNPHAWLARYRAGDRANCQNMSSDAAHAVPISRHKSSSRKSTLGEGRARSEAEETRGYKRRRVAARQRMFWVA